MWIFDWLIFLLEEVNNNQTEKRMDSEKFAFDTKNKDFEFSNDNFTAIYLKNQEETFLFGDLLLTETFEYYWEIKIENCSENCNINIGIINPEKMKSSKKESQGWVKILKKKFFS